MNGNETSVPCLGCGYDLRGLSGEAVCPECGRPAADSLRDSMWVSRREFAQIVLRLLALWLLIPSAGQVLAVLVAFVITLATDGLGSVMGSYSWTLVFVVVQRSAPAAVAVAVWVFASRIARTVVPRDGRAFASPATPPEAWLRGGCQLLGIYLIVDGATWAASALLVGEGFAGFGAGYDNAGGLIASSLRAIAGALLLVGVRRGWRLLVALRTAGVSEGAEDQGQM